MLKTRNVPFKATALLAALTFVGVVGVDAAGLHGCDQHDALPTHDTEQHGHHGAAESLPDAGSHHAAPVAVQEGLSHDGAHDGPCTCLGACGVGNLGSAVVAASHVVEAAWSAASTSEPALADELLPAPPPFLLPYAIGPPQAA